MCKIIENGIHRKSKLMLLTSFSKCSKCKYVSKSFSTSQEENKILQNPTFLLLIFLTYQMPGMSKLPDCVTPCIPKNIQLKYNQIKFYVIWTFNNS